MLQRVLMRRCWLILTLGLVALPAQAGPTLFVSDMRAERGIDDGLRRLLGELLLTETQAAGLFEAVGGSDVDEMLKNATDKELAGCLDDACLAEIAGAVGAEYLLSSSVGSVGQSYLLNLKIMNTKTAQVTARLSETISGDEEDLVAGLRDAIDVLHERVQDTWSEHAAQSAAADGTASVWLTSTSWSFGLNEPSVAWTSAAGAVVGFGLFAYFGTTARSSHSAWEDKGRPDNDPDRDAGIRDQRIANVAGFAGVGLTAVSALFFYWATSAD